MILWHSPDARSLELTGHAAYGPPGADIVCAGVSGVAITLDEGLRTMRIRPCRREIRPGYYMIRVPEGPGVYLIAAALAALRRLAATYPGYLAGE